LIALRVIRVELTGRFCSSRSCIEICCCGMPGACVK
jgi:hypothetical protein